AADRAAAVLQERTVRHGMVNLGGDIRVIGPHLNGDAWKIGLTHPRDLTSTILTISVFSGAVATSGDYERFMEIEGKRYCHILSPKTGWPVDGFQSVTILSDSCLIAGSVATITMLYGEGRGKRFVREMELPRVLIDRNGKKEIYPRSLLHLERSS